LLRVQRKRSVCIACGIVVCPGRLSVSTTLTNNALCVRELFRAAFGCTAVMNVPLTKRTFQILPLGSACSSIAQKRSHSKSKNMRAHAQHTMSVDSSCGHSRTSCERTSDRPASSVEVCGRVWLGQPAMIGSASTGERRLSGAALSILLSRRLERHPLWRTGSTAAAAFFPAQRLLLKRDTQNLHF
jgi:hypothetical protein